MGDAYEALAATERRSWEDEARRQSREVERLKAQVSHLVGVAEALGAHRFEGVVQGVADRPCTRCNQADRAAIHQAHVLPYFGRQLQGQEPGQ